MTTTAESGIRALSDQIAEEIRVALTRRRMSQRQLAVQLGVSPAWLNYRLTGVQEIGVNDLQRIADALGITVLELFPSTVRAGDAPINQHSSTVGRSDDPKRVRHLATRPFGPSRRDLPRPPSGVPLTQRRPSPIRPPTRAMAV